MQLCLAVVFVCLLTLTPAAASDTKDTQAEAEALLDRARQLSDIRGSHAPSFRLKATFSIVGKELENLEGTYTELWASDSQFRKEIAGKNLQRVEVATPTRLWVLGPDDEAVSSELDRVLWAIGIFPAHSLKLSFESVRDRTPEDSSVRCAITNPVGEDKARRGYCFDPKVGVLVENIAPEPMGRRVGDYSCAYDNFKKFGDFLFPYDIDCRVDGHRKMQVHVTELVTQTFADLSVFNPPAGALEIGRCLGALVPPKGDSTPGPNFPPGMRGSTALVTLNLIVDVKGRTQNVNVARSAGKAFDDMAVGTVKRWRFKPATCDGEPLPLRISVQINFRQFH